MSFAYENVRDANQHLMHSVVMFAGAPAFVHEVIQGPEQGSFSVHLGHLPRIQNTFTVDLFHADFEPRNCRLGYVNVSSIGHALYCTRIPARQYHQGLVRGNVNIPRVEGRTVSTFEMLLQEPGFADALRNVYPTYEAAQGLLENPNYTSMAFNRRYALSKDELGFYRLHYKGEPVAFGEGKKFKVPEKFKYLREELMELGVEV